MTANFEYFEHTADIGMRVRAATSAALIESAIVGLRTLLVGDSEVGSNDTRTIDIRGVEADLLLFDALNEVLFAFETEGFLPAAAFVMKVEGDNWRIAMLGEAFDADRHTRHHEVKAVTYHGLSVNQSENGWCAEVIFDI